MTTVGSILIIWAIGWVLLKVVEDASQSKRDLVRWCMDGLAFVVVLQTSGPLWAIFAACTVEMLFVLVGKK